MRCAHIHKFFAYTDGLRTREATTPEALAWVAGQRHPLFSVVAPMFTCFNHNVRVGEIVVSYEVDECVCPPQPWID